jgi:hypothetical protein
MELLDYTSNWVKGEVTQGRIMVFIAALVIVAAFAIFKSNHEILKGTLIPLTLVIVAIGGYGSFQIFGRPGHVQKVETIYNESPEKAIGAEYEKGLKDRKIYTMIKKVWAGIIILGGILFFVFSSHYFKGLSIGISILGIAGMLLDSTLHYRLETYITNLETLIK